MSEDTEHEAKEQKPPMKEKKDPDNDGDSHDGEGVTVSEEYQKKAHDVTKDATKHHLNHLRGKINDREDTLRKEEMAKKPKKGKDSVPEVYDSSDMY